MSSQYTKNITLYSLFSPLTMLSMLASFTLISNKTLNTNGPFSSTVTFFTRRTFGSIRTSNSTHPFNTSYTYQTCTAFLTYRPLGNSTTDIYLFTFFTGSSNIAFASNRSWRSTSPLEPASIQEDLQTLQHHTSQLDLAFHWVLDRQNLLSNP